MNRYNIEYDGKGNYQAISPPANNYCKDCYYNVEWNTLPEDQKFHYTTLGPTSLKQLYWGPNFYPLQKYKKPYDTLYSDNALYWPEGKSPIEGVDRKTYQRSFFPLKDRMVRERLEYADKVLPTPSINKWTKYHTLREGSWER